MVLSVKPSWQGAGNGYYDLTVNYAVHPKLELKMEELRFEIDLLDAANGVEDAFPPCRWDETTSRASWLVRTEAQGGSPQRGAMRSLKLRYRTVGGMHSMSPINVHFGCASRNVSGLDVEYYSQHGVKFPISRQSTKAFKTGVYQVYP